MAASTADGGVRRSIAADGIVRWAGESAENQWVRHKDFSIHAAKSLRAGGKPFDPEKVTGEKSTIAGGHEGSIKQQPT